MEEERRWYVGIDWASVDHVVRVSDAHGTKIGERSFKHGGEGLNALASWILEVTKAPPAPVHIAIEVPHGPIVESLMEHGFNVYAINPNSLTGFARVSLSDGQTARWFATRGDKPSDP